MFLAFITGAAGSLFSFIDPAFAVPAFIAPAFIAPAEATALLSTFPETLQAIPPDILPTIERLHDHVMTISWILLFVAMVAAGIMSVTGIAAGLDVDEKALFKQAVLSAFLMANFSLLFGFVVNGINGLTEVVVPPEYTAQMADVASRNTTVIGSPQATPNPSPNPSPGASPSGSPTTTSTPPADPTPAATGLGMLKDLVYNMADMTGNLKDLILSALIGQVARLILMLTSLVMNIVYYIGMIVLFVFGPVILALGVIPKIGYRMLSNYFGILTQLSLWQVWLQLCTWMVVAMYATSTEMAINRILKNVEGNPSGAGIEGFFDITQSSLYSSGLAITASLLILATPYVIRGMFPFVAGGGLSRGIAGAATTMIAYGASVQSLTRRDNPNDRNSSGSRGSTGSAGGSVAGQSGPGGGWRRSSGTSTP